MAEKTITLFGVGSAMQVIGLVVLLLCMCSYTCNQTISASDGEKTYSIGCAAAGKDEGQ